MQSGPTQIKSVVGYVPESPRLHEFVTAAEYLDSIADVRGLSYHEKGERIKRLIEALDIDGKESDTVR